MKAHLNKDFILIAKYTSKFTKTFSMQPFRMLVFQNETKMNDHDENAMYGWLSLVKKTIKLHNRELKESFNKEIKAVRDEMQ